jgi:hypothetical protein
MSIRTRILGSVAAATLTAGLGLAALPAGAAGPGPVDGPDDIKICEELEITPADDCFDHPVEEPDPEPDPDPDPQVDDDPKPGRPDFTG